MHGYGVIMAAKDGKSKSRVDQRPRSKAQGPISEQRHTRAHNRTVTLADVGNLAGVSPSTVSRVVSNRTPVSPEVREIVERAIVQLGYVPNRAARNLATSRSDSLGVLIYEPVSQWGNDPFIAPLLFGISEGLSDTDIQLILMMASTRQEEERVQQYIQKGHVDGVILVGSHGGDPALEQLVRRGVPIVFCGRPAVSIDVDYVEADHRSAARTAVCHLISGGRRRIATIYGTMDMPSSQDKLDGYRDALISAGLRPDPTLEVAGNYSPALAAEAMRALLEQHPDIDGVFVASDTMAAAAVGVIIRTGLQISEDISNFGYDRPPVAMANPPIVSALCQPNLSNRRARGPLLFMRGV